MRRIGVTRKKAGAPKVGEFAITSSWRYHVRYEAEETREDCQCDHICSCSRIESVKITDVSGVSYASLRITRKGKSRRTPYEPSEIEKYCIDRLMVNAGCYDLNRYEAVVTGGYYGQEIGDIEFHENDTLLRQVEEMLNLKWDEEKVLYCLGVEYGFIADIIKFSTGVRVVQKRLSEIMPSRGALMLKKQISYCREIKKGEIIGVLKDNMIIDGNHRFSYCMGVFGADHQMKFIELS